MSKFVSTCSRGIRKIGIFRMFLSLIGISTIILIIMHGHLTSRDNEDNTRTTQRQILKNSLGATKSKSAEKRRVFDQMHETQPADPPKGHAAHHHTPHVTQIGAEVPLFSMKTSSLMSSSKEKKNNHILPLASALDRRDYVRLLHRDELDAAERETREQQQRRQQQQRQLPPFSSSSSISLALNRKPLGSREEEEEEVEEDDVGGGGGGGGTKTMGVDPLDIQVTQHWEQITAELWSALSHGTVPTLPTTSETGGGGEGGEGGGGGGGEEEDDAASASVAKFIKTAVSGGGGNRMQELLDSDDRCSIMFKLLEEEIGSSKRGEKKKLLFFLFSTPEIS